MLGSLKLRTIAVRGGFMASVRAHVALNEIRRLLKRTTFADWPEAQPLGTPEVYGVRPALYEPAQLDRVTACGFGRSLASEVEKLDATSAVSRPPVLHEFRDAVFWSGHIHAGGRIHHLSARRFRPRPFDALTGFDEITLTHSALGMQYFGHWLQDDCSLREMDLGAPVDSVPLPDWPDVGVYARAFGQDWTARAPFFRAGRLRIASDIGFGPGKAERFRTLRARLRAARPRRDAAPEIAYIRRGGGAARAMVNEDELVAALSRRGVAVVETESLRGPALPDAILDARIVIGVEGSNLTHAIYALADGGGLCVLQPPDRFYNPNHEWARLLGMASGLVVGRPREGGFRIEPDEVLSMLDRLAAAQAAGG